MSTSSLPNTFVFSKGYLESAQLSVATRVEKQGHGVEAPPEGKSLSCSLTVDADWT